MHKVFFILYYLSHLTKLKIAILIVELLKTQLVTQNAFFREAHTNTRVKEDPNVEITKIAIELVELVGEVDHTHVKKVHRIMLFRQC